MQRFPIVISILLAASTAWGQVPSADQPAASPSGADRMWKRFDIERWLPVRIVDDAVAGYDPKKTDVLGNGKYRTWFRWDYAAPQKASAFEYSYSIEKVEVDCRRLSYRTLAEYAYDEGGSSVNSFVPKDAAKQTWTDVVPESVGETVYSEFCSSVTAAAEPKRKRKRE